MEELSGKLTNNLNRSSVEVVMEDEKYFTLSGHKILGNAGYYSSDKSKCSDKVRFAGKEKYLTKVLIWITISAHVISKPLIRQSKSEAINSDIYINECLAKKATPIHPQASSRLQLHFMARFGPSLLLQANCGWTRTLTMSPSHSTLQMSHRHAQSKNVGSGWLKKCTREAGKPQASNSWFAASSPRSKNLNLKSVKKLMTGVKAKLKSIADDGVFSYLK